MAPFLRDGPPAVAHLDPAELRRALADAEARGDLAEQMRVCGLLSEFERAHGRDGAPMARRAVALAAALGDDAAVVRQRLRAATADLYSARHESAERELRELLDARGDLDPPLLIDFVHQHLGKCLAEQSRFAEAGVQFARALELRSDADLRASSEAALVAAARADEAARASSGSGRVRTIHVSPARGLAMRAVPNVALVSGGGIPGDRYHRSRHRHVSVQSAEALSEAAVEFGAPIDPAATRRNITIEGVAVPTAPGTPVHIGGARLEVVRIAAPCRLLDDDIGDGARVALRRRAGSILRVVEGGAVAPGDPVIVEPVA